MASPYSDLLLYFKLPSVTTPSLPHTQPLHAHITTKQPTPPPIPPSPERTEPADGAWKEAFDKLRADFEKFKSDCERDIQFLTDDLDKERKIRAALEVDIDRLKKSIRDRH